MPGERENAIERYFKKRVKETGGIERKVIWQGRHGAPDRMAGWPVTGKHGLVELKRPEGGVLEAHQVREHDRLRAIGFRVDVISTREEVDAYVTMLSDSPVWAINFGDEVNL